MKTEINNMMYKEIVIDQSFRMTTMFSGTGTFSIEGDKDGNVRYYILNGISTNPKIPSRKEITKEEYREITSNYKKPFIQPRDRSAIENLFLIAALIIILGTIGMLMDLFKSI